MTKTQTTGSIISLRKPNEDTKNSNKIYVPNDTDQTPQTIEQLDLTILKIRGNCINKRNFFRIKMARRAAGFLIFRKMNEQIEYLLLKASYGKRHWTPPKGHVDPGEDDFTTALRETKEEAGYTDKDLVVHKDRAKVLNYKVDYKGRLQDKTVTYWLAELKNPQQNPILSDEHTEFRWLPKTAAVELSGYKDFEEMVEHFDETIRTL